MEKYLISGRQVDAALLSADDLSNLLAEHYVSYRHLPLRCLCRDPGEKLYIAKHSDKYFLKRWPATGNLHHFTCGKFEPPAEASGAGALIGSAIREDPKAGVTHLALGFSLKRIKRTIGEGKDALDPSEAADANQSPTKTEERKLTLKSILHYLWDEARLTRWEGAKEPRRNWASIYPRLMDVATGAATQKKPLSSFMYIPPLWNSDDSKRQEQARKAFIGQHITHSGGRKIMMIVAEVKAVDPSQFGFRISLRSMPDTQIYMKQDLWERLQAKYGYEIARWREDSVVDGASRGGVNSHMIAAMTVWVSPTGTCNVEDVAFMCVTKEWIPVANFHENLLICSAVASGRSFIKPMAYNLGRGRTLPAAILVDTTPIQTNVFISTPDESDVLVQSRQQLIGSSSLRARSIIWDVQEPVEIDEILDGLPVASAPSEPEYPDYDPQTGEYV